MKNIFNEAYLTMFSKNNVIKEKVSPLNVSQLENRVEKCKMFLSRKEVEELFKAYLEKINEEDIKVLGYTFSAFNILKNVDKLVFNECIDRFVSDNELEETEDDNPQRAYSKVYETVGVDGDSTKYLIEIDVWGGHIAPAEYIFTIKDKDTNEVLAVNDRNYTSHDEAYKDALDTAEALEEQDIE